MWKKLKQIFISKDVEVEVTPEIVETTSPAPQPNNSQEIKTEIPEESELSTEGTKSTEEIATYGLSVADAILCIIHDHGKGFMQSSGALNALSDYGAFKDNRAYQSISKLLISEGIYNEIITVSDSDFLENKIQGWSHIIASKYGTDRNLITTLLWEITLGLGLLSIDDYHKAMLSSVEEPLQDEIEPERAITPTAQSKYDPNTALSRYIIPSVDTIPPGIDSTFDSSLLDEGKQRIEWVFASQGIPVNKITAYAGPRTSLYELEIEVKKVGRVSRMEKELLASLSPAGCRILNPIPGKFAVGVELPNPDNTCHCNTRDVFDNEIFLNSDYTLPITLGFDSKGETIVKDLSQLSHILICGEMGQGKTSLVRQILTSILLKKTPEEVKFILFDGNGLELSDFQKLGRYFFAQRMDDNDSVVNNYYNATKVLESLMLDIEARRKLFQDAGVRSIEEYNTKFCERKLNPGNGHRYLPYIVVVCDEFTPLHTDGTKAFESLVSTILEKAASAGVYCIFTTKYTTSDILTPSVRNSFPTKISFRVHLPNESRLILGNNLATNLLANGDMLLLNEGNIERIQSPRCDAEDVEGILNYIESQSLPDTPYILPSLDDIFSVSISLSDRDSLFEDAAHYIVSFQTTSTSMLQRKFNIGYNRAGKLMDEMAAAGIIGPIKGAKPRDVLVDPMGLEQILKTL